MHKVLIVDDDPHIREVVCFALHKAGYLTITAANGVDALAQHETEAPNLIILDVLMPELDGLAVCRQLRQISNVPILMLSSRDEEVDKILGLEMGADDYISKPFSPRELVARVSANLRRQDDLSGNTSAAASMASATIELEDYRINSDTFEASWQSKSLALTQTEFHLLRILAQRPDKVFTRDALMQGAYDVRKVVSRRTIDSHIRRLRDKLMRVGAPGIRTVHGIGYRLQLNADT